PAIAEAILVGIAVLRDDRRYPVRVLHGEPKSSRCAVIEYVDGITIKTNDLGETIDDAGDIVERVIEFFSWRHFGSTEPRKVRCDDIKSIGEERYQVAEHVSRAREAVQQQQLAPIGRSRLAIEDLETIDIDRAIPDRRHETLLGL